MPFRHIVLLDLDDACDVDGVVAALRELPAAIPEIDSYVVGRDAGVNPGNATVAVVADFAGVDQYLVYRDHPAHVHVINEHVKPHLTSRAALQHEM